MNDFWYILYKCQKYAAEDYRQLKNSFNFGFCVQYFKDQGGFGVMYVANI